MQIFYNNITVLDIGVRRLEALRAKKVGTKIRVLQRDFLLPEFEEKKEKKLKELSKKYAVDVEDLVIYSFPIENILFMNLNVPPKMDKRMIKNFALIEISRNLNLRPEEIVVDILEVFEGKALLVVSKREHIVQYVNKLVALGFYEPDILIPDVFKYLEFSNNTMGRKCLIIYNFFEDYYSIIFFIGSYVVAIRIVLSNLWDYMEMMRESIGIPPVDLVSLGNLKDLPEVEKFLLTNFEDILIELEREIKLTSETAISSVSIDEIDRFEFLVDPPVLSDVLNKALSGSSTFSSKDFEVIKPPESVETLGGLGLLLRGGRELGKVKSIHL
ncbi:MAG: hypothetical protein DRP23_01490 [Thermotogae bacterium]|nr:MAG: hypothetical protein DRP23_01490 [Thermotogota bacterium]